MAKVDVGSCILMAGCSLINGLVGLDKLLKRAGN